MMSGAHNQLTEMVNPGRISKEIGRFVRAGATTFLLVNVSEYFTTPYMNDSSLKGEHWIHRCLRRLEGKAHPLIAAKKDLDPEVLGMAKEWLQFSIENRKAMESLAEKAGKLKARIPASRQDFYQSHLLTQIQIHLQSFAALEATCRAVLAHGDHDQPMALKQTAGALAAGERLQDALRKAEYGKWAAWYAGERFIDLQRTRLTLQDLRTVLNGEPFLKNYPLFYPPTQRPTR